LSETTPTEHVKSDFLTPKVVAARFASTPFGVAESGALLPGVFTEECPGKRTIYAANGTTVRTVSSHKNTFGYTSRRQDYSGLMYYRARYYDTGTGEFISQDPLEYADGMSQYRGYFTPGATDPEGTWVVPAICATSCATCAIGAVAVFGGCGGAATYNI
jgi:RHS repeat-associated protein